MPLSPLAVAMILYECRGTLQDEYSKTFDPAQVELILAIVAGALQHQNVSGQRFPGD